MPTAPSSSSNSKSISEKASLSSSESTSSTVTPVSSVMSDISATFCSEPAVALGRISRTIGSPTDSPGINGPAMIVNTSLPAAWIQLLLSLGLRMSPSGIWSITLML